MLSYPAVPTDPPCLYVQRAITSILGGSIQRVILSNQQLDSFWETPSTASSHPTSSYVQFGKLYRTRHRINRAITFFWRHRSQREITFILGKLHPTCHRRQRRVTFIVPSEPLSNQTSASVSNEKLDSLFETTTEKVAKKSRCQNKKPSSQKS